jgi:hypothetical protein
MKKFIVITFFMAIAILALASQCYAVDWSQYESGRDNIRLDGYQGQPGYIAFTDGNGTTLGYMWMGANNKIKWCSKAAIDLTTTKLTDAYGVNLRE